MVVEVQGLVVRYGTTLAVAGIDLHAGAGQVLVVLGPNGAGKTSTVETLEGYRAPSAGRVRVLGLDPRGDHRHLRGRIGVMLQRGGVYPAMSPREALRLWASYYPSPLAPAGLVEQLGLAAVATTPWRRLSGGEQQRLSLGLALVGRPEVAFLDEPTAGVDPQGRLAIRQVIAGLRDDGVCVVVTTHELDEAERMADRVVIIDRGLVVGEGTPAELTGGAGGDEVRFGAGAGLDVASLGEAVGAPVSEVRPGEYLVGAAGTPVRVAALTAWLAERDQALADLRAGRQRLEDVFLRLTGDR
ncbi:MAG: ABC transporter ATP-binding protein [Acidimicrobiales bacterium]